MARIRTIKPSFFTSFAMAEHPHSTRLTFIGLWTYVDDEGRAPDDPRLIKGAIWPLDDAMTTKKVEAELKRLATAGQIIRYEACGRRYLAITQWKDHQRINRPTPSSHPSPLTDEYAIPHGPLTSTSRSPHGADSEPSRPEGNKEGKREEGTGRQEQGQPPTPFAAQPVENITDDDDQEPNP